MFDVLGVVSFLFIVFCLIMCIVSLFSRRTNRRLWSVMLIPGLIVFFVSYALDLKFDKDEPIEIDYSGIVIETPSPSPAATPVQTATPVPTETPEMTAEPETDATPETSPEMSSETEETAVAEETPEAEGE